MSSVKVVARGLLPHSLLVLMKRAHARFHSKKTTNLRDCLHEYQADVGVAMYEHGRTPFLFPQTDLRYAGGLAFSPEQHHFIRYYEYGRDALDAFYQRFQPRNIFECHFLPTSSREVNIDSLPWSVAATESSFYGESGLDHTHGRQQFGPVSQQKVSLEAKRLTELLSSIRRHGYRVELGFPRGYLLENERDQFRFVVVGGQHRAAALSYLGYEFVPVIFQPDWPRVIRRSEVHAWPQVRNGNISSESALQLFDSYFRDSEIDLLEGWSI